MLGPVEPAYRFVEHVGELELELHAPTEAGVFAAALGALAELIADGGPGEPAEHGVELSGADPALLLVDWLDELVYLAETAGFVPERVSSLEVDDGGLRARVAGFRGSPRHLVKAVTLHRLDLHEDADGWRGRVVLDV
jgi:SHS2 domain-containing protein